MPVGVPREILERLVYGNDRGSRRFTQDSPILPDVWFAYGERPGARVDLLLRPLHESSPGALARHIRERLARSPAAPSESSAARVAYNQSIVAVSLTFEELIRVALPLTRWWQHYLQREQQGSANRLGVDDLLRAPRSAQWAAALEDPDYQPKSGRIPAEVRWFVRIAGTIAKARRSRSLRTLPQATALIKAFTDLAQLTVAERAPRSLWSVSLNRDASVAVHRSSSTIKADAARRLFELSARNLVWAVMDTGVDATHPAFRRRDGEGHPRSSAFGAGGGTRILATYDFTRIRDLLTVAEDREEALSLDEVERRRELRRSLQSGRLLDWQLLEPHLRVPHGDGYVPPSHPHGTHVAGILAADWRTTDPGMPELEDVRGVCPDIGIYDIRVLDDDGRGDEFSIIAALQFVRSLNAHEDHVAVHGVNLSFSIPHEVANYACGRTPVCEEAERLIGSGIVVVAAAGNRGYEDGDQAYRSISITDPGNAEGVITVGATHRERPHTYGVSYFSSRGPTGDGRSKPDLVAPGEKIFSTIPGGQTMRMDGTSMAAPHVSGAAALLMARHRELVGQPGRVKHVLCSSATSLGRLPFFQGAGLLDVLRALQAL